MLEVINGEELADDREAWRGVVVAAKGQYMAYIKPWIEGRKEGRKEGLSLNNVYVKNYPHRNGTHIEKKMNITYHLLFF